MFSSCISLKVGICDESKLIACAAEIVDKIESPDRAEKPVLATGEALTSRSDTFELKHVQILRKELLD